MNLRVFPIFLLAFVGISNGYKPCIEYESVSIDEPWFLSLKTFYVIAHSGCTTCENDENWKWIMGRTTPKTLCYTSKTKVRGESYTFILRCEYQDIRTQSCELDTSSLSGDKKVGVKGIKKFAGTNNKTWFALTMCLTGREQWWMILATEPTIPDEEKQAGLDELAKLGFDTDPASYMTRYIEFESFELIPCEGS